MAITGAGAAIGQQAEAMQACREQYWEECSDANKIERLREEVARLCRTVTELSSLVVKLGAHRHGATGELLIPMLGDDRANRPGLFAHDNGIPHSLRKERERR